MRTKLRQRPTPVNSSSRPQPVSLELAVAELSLGQRKLAEGIEHMLAMLDVLVTAPPVAKRLLTQEELCEALGYSRSYVHTMHQLGCPVIRVTDSPRYDLEDVLAWMKANPRQAAGAK